MHRQHIFAYTLFSFYLSLIWGLWLWNVNIEYKSYKWGCLLENLHFNSLSSLSVDWMCSQIWSPGKEAGWFFSVFLPSSYLIVVVVNFYYIFGCLEDLGWVMSCIVILSMQIVMYLFWCVEVGFELFSSSTSEFWQQIIWALTMVLKTQIRSLRSSTAAFKPQCLINSSNLWHTVNVTPQPHMCLAAWETSGCL